MIPSLVVGDHLFVNKFIYGIRIPFTFYKLFEFSRPLPGDIIVFINPNDPSLDFIKRVVGVEGDEVLLENNQLFINGQKIEYLDRGLFEFVDEKTGQKLQSNILDENLGPDKHNIIVFNDYSSFGPVKVNPGHVFVMGDNRDNSSDSRFIGQIPLNHIKGKAIIIWYSRSERTGINWGRFFKIIR